MAALFKDLKQGHTVHIFDRKTAQYQTGVVASDPSLPHYHSTQPTMVVDVAITIGQDTKTYSIPESLSTTYCGDTCISTGTEDILSEIDQLASQADIAIQAVPNWERVKARCAELRESLDPKIKEKRMLDERMAKMEESMCDMKGMFKDLMEKLGRTV